MFGKGTYVRALDLLGTPNPTNEQAARLALAIWGAGYNPVVLDMSGVNTTLDFWRYFLGQYGQYHGIAYEDMPTVSTTLSFANLTQLQRQQILSLWPEYHAQFMQD